MKDFYSLIKYVIIPVQFYTYFKTVPIVSPFSNFLSLFFSLFVYAVLLLWIFPLFCWPPPSFSNPVSKCQQNHWHLKRPKKWPLHWWDIFPGLILQESPDQSNGCRSCKFLCSINYFIFIHSFCKEQSSRHCGYNSEQINRPCKVPAWGTYLLIGAHRCPLNLLLNKRRE